MPTPVLAQVVLHHRSNLAKDQVVNTFAFNVAGAPVASADFDNIKAALIDFYNTAPSGHNSIAGILAPCIDRIVPADIRYYDLTGHLDGTAHGSPERIDTFVLGDMITGGVGYPSELAVCMSFHSLYGGDVEFAPGSRPRARDRGRVYIGPLVRSVGDQDALTQAIRVSQTTRETVVQAGGRLRATAAINWSVWSRKAAALKVATLVSCDDAFDVQRRRGEAPLVRTSG
jgi:hypothetical protein